MSYSHYDVFLAEFPACCTTTTWNQSLFDVNHLRYILIASALPVGYSKVNNVNGMPRTQYVRSRGLLR